jgi:hypothetical protein
LQGKENFINLAILAGQKVFGFHSVSISIYRKFDWYRIEPSIPQEENCKEFNIVENFLQGKVEPLTLFPPVVLLYI